MYKCKKTGKSFKSLQGLAFHVSANYSTLEEGYKGEHGLTETPKCTYHKDCGSNAKFINFSKGYYKTCGSKECIKRQTTEANIKIGKNRTNTEIPGLRKHIIDNLDFYIENKSKKHFIEPFTGKDVKGRSLLRFISSNLVKMKEEKEFNKVRKCGYCDKEYSYYVFGNNNGFCSDKSCISERTNNPIKRDYNDLISFKYNIKDISSKNAQLIEEYINSKVKEATIETIDDLNDILLKYYNYKNSADYHIRLNEFKNCNIVEHRYGDLTRKRIKEHNPKLYKDVYFIQCINCKKDMLINFHEDKNKFCSHKCYWAAVKEHDTYSRPYTEESKAKQSKTMVDKINRGEFVAYGGTRGWSKTPNIYKGKNYRSSWEVCFKMLNPHLQYEELRILYENPVDGKTRNYILDFQDFDKKIMYEVKPTCHVDNEVVQVKEKFAKEWAKENGWTFEFVTEDYFKTNIDKIENNLHLVDDENTVRRIKNFIRDLKKRK